MGILQARILEWVAMPSSRDLPNPGLPHCRQIHYHLSPQGSPRTPLFCGYPHLQVWEPGVAVRTQRQSHNQGLTRATTDLLGQMLLRDEEDVTSLSSVLAALRLPNH